MFIAMSQPSLSAAPIGAASSSLDVLRKRATCATRPKGQKRQSNIANTNKFPRSSTSLGSSTRGLPALSAAKTRGTVICPYFLETSFMCLPTSVAKGNLTLLGETGGSCQTLNNSDIFLKNARRNAHQMTTSHCPPLSYKRTVKRTSWGGEA